MARLVKWPMVSMGQQATASRAHWQAREATPGSESAPSLDIEALRAQARGTYDLMFVDTGAAFYTGEEENDNRQMQDLS